jgi:hypothetical protein
MIFSTLDSGDLYLCGVVGNEAINAFRKQSFGAHPRQVLSVAFSPTCIFVLVQIPNVRKILNNKKKANCNLISSKFRKKILLKFGVGVDHLKVNWVVELQHRMIHRKLLLN